ncbi:hypothetical protein CSB11_02545 [Candidatus Campbellbacteria bacterium]|nr:MAG: hypothetical protein CSB11_02545 [Candidatus Campbellbacteria bacterium]
MKKITIIGAGDVGSHIASACIHQNLNAQIYLVDINQKFEEAQILDLKDTLAFTKNTQIAGADLADDVVKQSDIFVITAGVRQKEGEDRISLLDRNIKILKSIKSEIGEVKKSAIVILVTNPVDLLTQSASEIFNLDKKQVFGTGTSLDSSRLKWHLAEALNKKPNEIKAYVLGEHGDSSFVYWSDFKDAKKFSKEQKEKIQNIVRTQAYEIIEGKGSTYFGIGFVTSQILKSIVGNENQIFSLSCCQSGEFGFEDISIGVLARVSNKGVKILNKKLNKEEQKLFDISVKKMQKVLKKCILCKI